MIVLGFSMMGLVTSTSLLAPYWARNLPGVVVLSAAVGSVPLAYLIAVMLLTGPEIVNIRSPTIPLPWPELRAALTYAAIIPVAAAIGSLLPAPPAGDTEYMQMSMAFMGALCVAVCIIGDPLELFPDRNQQHQSRRVRI